MNTSEAVKQRESWQLINNTNYRLARYEEKHPEEGDRKWFNLENLNGIYYPLGYQDKNAKIVRILSYLPVLGFYGGLVDMVRSIEMLFQKVIRNKNSFNHIERKTNENLKTITETKHIYLIDLNKNERGILFGLSIALFFRGVMTFCQLGVLFAPFDYLFDKYVD